MTALHESLQAGTRSIDEKKAHLPETARTPLSASGAVRVSGPRLEANRHLAETTRMTEAERSAVPSLYEWVGGKERLKILFERFYELVRRDALLQPVFEGMSAHHAEHVAAFVGEVFGGPAEYSQSHGGHPSMIRHHLARHLTEEQRRRWVALLLDAADQVGLPDDPEFRAALVGYLEWGSRLAVINSRDGASAPDPNAAMPAWNWGPPGGPWQGS